MLRFVPHSVAQSRAVAAVSRVACALAIWSVSAAPAAAGPVVPRATPLSVFGTTETAQVCPTTGELDGSRLSAIARDAVLGGGEDGAVFVGFLMAFLPTPAVAVCDPDLAAGTVPLGPFGGATHHDLSADVAYPGIRAIGTPPEGFQDSELVPGDRVELPAAGARSTLDVMVATSRGAKITRVSPLGAPRATAVRVEGALSSPTLVVEREAGEPTRVAVAPPPAAAKKITPQLRGRTVRFGGTVPPGSLVTASSGELDGTAVVAGASGRFSRLDVRVGPSRRVIDVTVASLERRQLIGVRCSVRWSKARRLADRVRCKATKASAARASRALRSGQQTVTEESPEVARARPTARAAAALPPAEATVTGLVKIQRNDEARLTGDVNGDGRPEVTVGTLTARGPQYSLAVSRVAGAPVLVPLRLDSDSFAMPGSLPDLDGDGRDELVSGNAVVVTDALAAPTLPVRIDLRSLRPTSQRDLDLGLASRDSLLSSLLTPIDPLGAVTDTTGDGRPELVFGSSGLAAVFPSQAVVPGIRSRLAQIFPLAWLGGVSTEELLGELDAAAALGDLEFEEDSTADLQVLTAASDPGALVRGQQFVRLSPTDPAIATNKPRTFALSRHGGGTQAVGTTTFRATGLPLLFDYDPASGDALVALFQADGCRASRCLDRLLRIGSAGELRSVTAFRRRPDAYLDGGFISDGPDADSAVDTAIWRAGGDDDVDVAPGDRSVAVLPSADGGPRKLGSLAVLSRQGRPVELYGVQLQVMPNGSRWLAGYTRSGAFASLALRP